MKNYFIDEIIFPKKNFLFELRNNYYLIHASISL